MHAKVVAAAGALCGVAVCFAAPSVAKESCLYLMEKAVAA